jgi:hypothetical protein
MTPSALRFALQSAQLTSHMHLQRPTNHALSSSDPLDPICRGTVPAYVGVNWIVDQPHDLYYRISTCTTGPALALQDQHLHYRNSWMNNVAARVSCY